MLSSSSKVSGRIASQLVDQVLVQLGRVVRRNVAAQPGNVSYFAYQCPKLRRVYELPKFLCAGDAGVLSGNISAAMPAAPAPLRRERTGWL